MQSSRLGVGGILAAALTCGGLVVTSAASGRMGRVASRSGHVVQSGAGIEPSASVPTNQTLFEFRSGFWINLHHFLYRHAVLATPGARHGHAEASAEKAEPDGPLSPADESTWATAEAFYARYGSRDALTDPELVRVNYELSDAGNSPTLEGRNLPAELRATLEAAAPVYRAHWWQAHDRLNRSWIAASSALVRAYGVALSRRTASAFAIEWPTERTTVEVVGYADWAGAYTVTHGTLITISSTDEQVQGPAALETLFHEASHALVDRLRDRLYADLQARGKTPTFDVVHVLIFYTAGALTTEALATQGITYVPYAEKNGLYERAANWSHYREVCDKDWRPYLAGTTTWDVALTNLARDF